MNYLLPIETSASLINQVHHAEFSDLCERVYRAGVRVDMILCDLPYGTTACAWDTVIPFEPMWKAFKRVVKPSGAIVLTAAQPFTTRLIASNYEMFKYCWYWYKNMPSNFTNVSIQPFRNIEEICVFYTEQPTYSPQPTERLITDRKVTVGASNGTKSIKRKNDYHFSEIEARGYHFREHVNPRNVLEFACVPHSTGTLHPSQKPVDLFRYLIRTYTLPGQLVFDPTVGSGTTAVAAREEGRRFIVGDLYYAEVARKRLAAPFTPSFLPLLDALSATP